MAQENPNSSTPSQEDLNKRIEEAKRLKQQERIKKLRLKYDHNTDNYDEVAGWIDSLAVPDKITQELHEKLDSFRGNAVEAEKRYAERLKKKTGTMRGIKSFLSKKTASNKEIEKQALKYENPQEWGKEVLEDAVREEVKKLRNYWNINKKAKHDDFADSKEKIEQLYHNPRAYFADKYENWRNPETKKVDDKGKNHDFDYEVREYKKATRLNEARAAYTEPIKVKELDDLYAEVTGGSAETAPRVQSSEMQLVLLRADIEKSLAGQYEAAEDDSDEEEKIEEALNAVRGEGFFDPGVMLVASKYLSDEQKDQLKKLRQNFGFDVPESIASNDTSIPLNRAHIEYLSRYHKYKTEMKAGKRIGQGLKDALWSEVELPPQLRWAKGEVEKAQKAHIAKLYEAETGRIESLGLSPEELEKEKAAALRNIFEDEVVKRAQEMQRLEAEAASMREKSRLEKWGAWYAKRPAWQRVALGAAVGTTIVGAVSLAGAATFGAGATATAAYAGTRLARGAAAYGIFKGYDAILNKAVDENKIQQQTTEEISDEVAAQAEGEKEASEVIQGLEQALEDYKQTIQAKFQTQRVKRIAKLFMGGALAGLAFAEGTAISYDASENVDVEPVANPGSTIQGATEDFTRKIGSLETIQPSPIEQTISTPDSLQADGTSAPTESLDQDAGQQASSNESNNSVADPDSRVDMDQMESIDVDQVEQTTPIGAPETMSGPLPDEAYIQKGDGYTHAYLRQLEANTNGIAEKLGFDPDASMAEKKVFVAKLAEKLGQLESVDVDGDGFISTGERWNAGDGLKYNPDKGPQIAVVLDVDADGNPVVQKFFEGKLVASKGIPGYEMSYGPAAGSGVATETTADSGMLSKAELEKMVEETPTYKTSGGDVLTADELKAKVAGMGKGMTGDYSETPSKMLSKDDLESMLKAGSESVKSPIENVPGAGQFIADSQYFKNYAFDFEKNASGSITNWVRLETDGGRFLADTYPTDKLGPGWENVDPKLVDLLKEAKALQELYKPIDPEYQFLQKSIIDKIMPPVDVTAADAAEAATSAASETAPGVRNITGAADNDFLVENNIHTNWRNQSGMLDAVTRGQVTSKLNQMAAYTQDLQSLEPGSPEYIALESKMDGIESELRETYGKSLFTDMPEEVASSPELSREEILEQSGMNERQLRNLSADQVESELQNVFGTQEKLRSIDQWREVRNTSAREILDSGVGRYEGATLESIRASEGPLEDKLAGYASYIRQQTGIIPETTEKLDDYLNRAHEKLTLQTISNNQ
jgi:hypothetical protein